VACHAEDRKAVCLVRLAWAELRAGDAGRAEQTARSALKIAVDLDHLMTLGYVITYAAIIAAESDDLARLAELLADADLVWKRLSERYLMVVLEALRGWLDVCEGSAGGIEKIVRSVARSRTDGETLPPLVYLLSPGPAPRHGGGVPPGTTRHTRGALADTPLRPALSRGRAVATRR